MSLIVLKQYYKVSPITLTVVPMFMKMPNSFEDLTTRLHFQCVVEVSPCHLSPATPFIYRRATADLLTLVGCSEVVPCDDDFRATTPPMSPGVSVLTTQLRLRAQGMRGLY